MPTQVAQDDKLQSGQDCWGHQAGILKANLRGARTLIDMRLRCGCGSAAKYTFHCYFWEQHCDLLPFSCSEHWEDVWQPFHCWEACGLLIVRLVGSSVATSETAYVSETNNWLMGNSSGGRPCCQHAHRMLPQNAWHLWHYVWHNCPFKSGG